MSMKNLKFKKLGKYVEDRTATFTDFMDTIVGWGCAYLRFPNCDELLRVSHRPNLKCYLIWKLTEDDANNANYCDEDVYATASSMREVRKILWKIKKECARWNLE